MARPIFITKFLIPSLNDQRFGHRLEWVDREIGVFQLLWNHKAAHAWTERDAQVFLAWDRMKGRDQSSRKDYFSRSKQRFRALLYKFTNERLLRRLESEDKRFHRFCIVQKSATSTYENEVISLEEEEMIDFENLWNGDLNQIGDSEKFQMNFHALLKDHMYSAELKPQSTDAEDPFWSNFQWEMDQLSPNPPTLYDALLGDPNCADVCFVGENHQHGCFENSLHVELTVLPDADAKAML